MGDHNAKKSLTVPPLLELMKSKPSMRTIHEDLMRTIEICFGALRAVLGHTTEDAIQDKGLKDLEAQSEILVLSCSDKLFEEINNAPPEASMEHDAHEELTKDIRVRLTVAVGALRSASMHCGEIGMLSLQENIY